MIDKLAETTTAIDNAFASMMSDTPNAKPDIPLYQISEDALRINEAQPQDENQYA